MPCCDPDAIRESSRQECEKSAPFEAGGDRDLSQGPVERRRCTDVGCLLLFFAVVGLFLYVSIGSVRDVGELKFVQPRDFAGDYCGFSKQWNGGADLEAFPAAAFTLNVTQAFNEVSRSFVCSSGVKALLVPERLSAAAFAAACDGAAPSCESLSECSSLASDAFERYFDLQRVQDVVRSPNLFVQLGSNFNRVCSKDCSLNASAATAPGSRTALYSPPADQPWSRLWQSMVEVAPAKGISLEPFTLRALPQSLCPYGPEMCVPLPGLKFEHLFHGYCAPVVDAGALSGISEAAGRALSGVARRAAAGLSGGMDSVFGQFQGTMDTFALVAAIAFFGGIIFLILLRFFLKPFVWLSILLVFLAFAAGGYILRFYASMCADEDIEAVLSQEGLANTMNSTCDGLYHFQDETTRKVFAWSGYVVWFLAALWLLAVICLAKRIRLAISLNQVAATFVYQTPHITLVPIVQYLAAAAWTAAWLFLTASLISEVPSSVPTRTFATWAEAHGTSETSGACTDSFPSGIAFLDRAAGSCNLAEAVPRCWSCAPPRFTMGYRFWGALFVICWTNALTVAAGQCVVAGAAGSWFFRGSSGRHSSRFAVWTAVKNSFFFHLGSLAFGSLILAIVQVVKWFMLWLSQQAKAQRNKCVEVIAKVCTCCLWCFEKCIKFLNKNAFIQVALMGTPFCTSARTAFFLVLRNAARVGVLGGLGAVVHLTAKLLLTAATGVVGFLLLEAMHPEVQAPVVLVVVYCVLGYISGSLFMNVFGLTVDTVLQCFVATEEMKIDTEFVPPKLRRFIDKHQGDSRTCGCGCLK